LLNCASQIFSSGNVAKELLDEFDRPADRRSSAACVFRSMWAGDSIRCGPRISGVMWARDSVLDVGRIFLFTVIAAPHGVIAAHIEWNKWPRTTVMAAHMERNGEKWARA